jgi:hypothetical protein
VVTVRLLVVVLPVAGLPVVAPPVVVLPVVGTAVRAVMNLIAYLVESTVFTSTTLLPFAIATFDWPLENDPPATLILIFVAETESRTNTGESDGKVAFRRTSSETSLTEILAATYALCGVVVVVLLVVVGDVVVEEVVTLPNGSLLLKRLNPLNCPGSGVYPLAFGSDSIVPDPGEGVPLEFAPDEVVVG